MTENAALLPPHIVEAARSLELYAREKGVMGVFYIGSLRYSLMECETHCATCQCNKLRETKPVPDNPLSKSWHDG